MYTRLMDEYLPAIRREVEQHYYLFDEFTLRQDYEGSCHRDTRCIFLRGPAGVNERTTVIDEYTFFHCMTFDDWDHRRLFPTVNRLIADVMQSNRYTELGWVTVVSLLPHGVIVPHIDEGDYCARFNRYHYPIISDNALFIVGDICQKPKPGELFVYDNQLVHSAINMGDNERIHLIFDAI